jgi:hypothetical protein
MRPAFFPFAAGRRADRRVSRRIVLGKRRALARGRVSRRAPPPVAGAHTDRCVLLCTQVSASWDCSWKLWDAAGKEVSTPPREGCESDVQLDPHPRAAL